MISAQFPAVQFHSVSRQPPQCTSNAEPSGGLEVSSQKMDRNRGFMMVIYWIKLNGHFMEKYWELDGFFYGHLIV